MKFFRKWVFLWTVFFIVMAFSSVSFAEHSKATIKVLSGEVFVLTSMAIPAKVGTVLESGDTLQTQVGANAVLELSDGSQLRLGENTNVRINELIQQTATGACISQVKLAWGVLQASLSSHHQKQGSSFSVETPNILVHAKLSQPHIEVIYDLNTNTTTV
jgi:ferric-dicitrate binding protein FerR (iron transport regulator)